MGNHENSGGGNSPRPKDRWDKAGIILKPAGGFLAALAVALVGYLGSSYLEKRQNTEMKMCLYTELISKREEAESALRKDMFAKIIGSFLKPDTGTIDGKLLELELLLYNFHESLNLGPLFQHLNRQIAADTSGVETKKSYSKRLQKVAKEIIGKQLAVLEVAGKKIDRQIDLRRLKDEPGGIMLEIDSLKIDKSERHFEVLVVDADTNIQEVRVELTITTPDKPADNVEAKFWVGPFDFPMIDNTRLTDDERCAVVLKAFEYPFADITLVYFPGSHAGLKEKPYYHEIVEKLMAENTQ